MDIIEIAKECGIKRYTAENYEKELQKFAQRIEAPHKQRIAELEKDCDILATNYDAARRASQFSADVADQALADLKAAEKQIEQLREALQAYRDARAMPSYADYAAIAYTPPEKTYDSSYGGGDCSRHGRYYGGGCISCENEWRKIRAQADRDAVHARDNALRKADDKARKALEETE